MSHIISASDQGMVHSGDSGDHTVSVQSDRDHPSKGCIDSLIGTLPTEGYSVIDARSLALPPSNQTSNDNHPLYTSFPAPDPDDNGSLQTTKILAAVGKFLVTYWNLVMLIFVPLGLLAPHIGCNDSAVFVLNCFAIVPLADMLCQATNSVASFMGETSGALVNVTMGNLTELVIFIQALLHRQYIIVRTSLLGSIVVNVLLVLGVAILTGEGREHGQVYNVLATRVAAALLCLTAVSLLVPSTIQWKSNDRKATNELTTLARAIAIVLIIVYFLYLWTQIRSAKYAYKPLIDIEDLTELQTEEEAVELGKRTTQHGKILYPRASIASPPLLSFTDSKSYDSFDIAAENRTDPSSALSRIAKTVVAIRCKTSAAWVHKTIPVILLITSTGLISLCSTNLVSSVDHFVTHTPISKTTVGLIILPIVGNAAELVSGIMFASRKQMDLAFAVSIGSAIQIALFVTPLVVLIGWGMDRDMTLHFTMFEGVTLITSTVLFLMLVFDGKCEVWKGVCLCAGYIVIALASYFVIDAE